jgi:uncharacterized membrane protein YtjA (UPF0391 family)
VPIPTTDWQVRWFLVGTSPKLRNYPKEQVAVTAGKKEIEAMLNLVVTLLIIALIAGLLGFGGIAGAAVGIAKIIFFVVIVLFLISVIGGLLGGSSRSLP